MNTSVERAQARYVDAHEAPLAPHGRSTFEFGADPFVSGVDVASTASSMTAKQASRTQRSVVRETSKKTTAAGRRGDPFRGRPASTHTQTLAKANAAFLLPLGRCRSRGRA